MLRGRELVVGCFPARAVTCTRKAGEFRVVLGTWLARLLSGHRERDGLQLTANGLERGQLASAAGSDVSPLARTVQLIARYREVVLCQPRTPPGFEKPQQQFQTQPTDN